VSRKVSGAVWALVTFCGRRLWRVLAISRKTHLASRGTGIRLRGQWTGKGEGAVSRVVGRVWCNELVVVLVVLLLVLLLWRVLRRSFASIVAKSSTAFCGRGAGRVWRISIPKAGKTDWAGLHVFACDCIVVWNDERLGDLVGL
jgi:hypothetical protein